MSEIVGDMQKASDALRGLQTLASMTARYEGFSVPKGRNQGLPAAAIENAATDVRNLAAAQHSLIERIIDNIANDIATLNGLDKNIARQILKLGG